MCSFDNSLIIVWFFPQESLQGAEMRGEPTAGARRRRSGDVFPSPPPLSLTSSHVHINAPWHEPLAVLQQPCDGGLAECQSCDSSPCRPIICRSHDTQHHRSIIAGCPGDDNTAFYEIMHFSRLLSSHVLLKMLTWVWSGPSRHRTRWLSKPQR